MAEAFGSKLLAGKKAVITGGGSGINFAIARRFADHGARVALIGRTKEKLDAAADEITSAGDSLFPVKPNPTTTNRSNTNKTHISP